MRNHVIDNLRGICMLGVIAIHIGSLALTANNFSLYVILEVLSRYSVPSFFFISGYGLFCQLNKPVTYLEFIKRRFRSVGVPYITWSLLYLLYFWLILPPGYVSWEPLHVGFTLFFGLGCYHLYFMVILLWFYLSFPLWRSLLLQINARGIKAGLLLLFIFQLAFNYWTTHPGLDISGWHVLWQNFFNYRLNYLPLHYLLIFICGGFTALYQKQVLNWLQNHSKTVILLYLASIVYLVGSCLNAYYCNNYTLLDLANTYHQLSPQGLIYTLTSLAFFCTFLPRIKAGTKTYYVLDLLSANSLFIYLIHPLLLDWMSSFYNHFGIIMTVKKVCLSYVLLVAFSLVASIILTRILTYFPLAAKLLAGRK